MNQPQIDRRQAPYPWTWEIPAGIALLVLTAIVSGIHVGRGLATLIYAHTWTWPTTPQLFRSLPAVSHGQASAGLPPQTSHLVATAHLSPVTVITIIFLTELALIATLSTAGFWAWETYGPGIRGTASRRQAHHHLGVARLRRQRHVIRPDLFSSKR